MAIVLEGVGCVGPDSKRLLKIRNGFRTPLLSDQCCTGVVQGISIVWVQCGSLLESGNRFVRLAHFQERRPHAVVGFRVVVVNRNRFAVRGEGVLVLAFMVLSVAQVVICDGIVRRQLDRLLEIGDCLRVFALSFQGLTQIMDGVLIVRLDRECLAKLLGGLFIGLVGEKVLTPFVKFNRLWRRSWSRLSQDTPWVESTEKKKNQAGQAKRLPAAA